jgi:hypothetical protein
LPGFLDLLTQAPGKQPRDPVQRRVADDRADGAGDDHRPQVEGPLGRERGAGVERRLAGKHRAHRVREHQRRDPDVGGAGMGRDGAERVAAAGDVENDRDDDQHRERCHGRHEGLARHGLHAPRWQRTLTSRADGASAAHPCGAHIIERAPQRGIATTPIGSGCRERKIYAAERLGPKTSFRT